MLTYKNVYDYIVEIDKENVLRTDANITRIMESANLEKQVVDMYDVNYPYTNADVIYHANERNFQFANLLYHLYIPYTIPRQLENIIQEQYLELGIFKNDKQPNSLKNVESKRRTSYALPFSIYIPTRAFGHISAGLIS